jgi:hypothetical protein
VSAGYLVLPKRRKAPTRAIAPPVIRPKTFVVAQVRQALQHAGATGAYSAARFTTGSVRAVTRSSMLPL